MDIEKLKALKTAVEIGSITQAAEHMGYSQPGLTGMLKRLEQEIGYPLLRRGTKGVRLTEAGEAVMPYIDRVFVTKINCCPQSDSYFENLDASADWRIASQSEALREGDIEYSFVCYERIKP